MRYTDRERDVIVADSFMELNYKQKKLLLASERRDNPQRQKYADALIKTAGEGVYNKIKREFCDEAYRGKITEGLSACGVECLTLKSEGYPEQLKNIPSPPLVLYMRGNSELIRDDLFAVVGSRKTLAQSRELCTKIAATLSERFTIVTGVADGADSAAVKGALTKGRIICVLASGHDGNSSANPALLREVESKGLTVSEYPPRTPAFKYTFLIRNRIIAGLSKGVLVVSAAQKSGALNTASYAAEYGREVFALPYGVGIESGKGCNNLIKNGAYLCEGADDVFSVFGMEGAETEAEQLGEEESALLAFLKEEGESHVETIAAALGKKPYEIMPLCSVLEIKGRIVRTGGNKFAAL